MNRRQALVLVGHGSQHHPASAAPLHAHAERIRETGPFGAVRTAFWKEEPSLREVRSLVEADVAFVVPVLTSEGYFADEVFPRELGVGDADAPVDGPEIRYTSPVGTHPAMTDVVVERVESTRQGPADRLAVVVVGHGTERNDRSGRSTREHASRLRDRGRYAEVDVAFLDEPPHVDSALDRVAAEEVVVVPLFVADGGHTAEDVPDALGHPGIGEAARIDGRLVHYTGAVGTEPRMADVVVERAVEAGANPDRSTTRGLGAAGTKFRRSVDAVDGQLVWGELAVVGTDGSYTLTHRDDADAPPAALVDLDGPEALRERLRRDDDGRFRPLSGARSLPGGWRFAGLDAVGLVRSVRVVYPGAIAHWYRAVRGELTTTDFPETVARQTGIYADLGRLGPRELAAATEAVCGDCVRSRRWRFEGEVEDGPAPDAGGEIPCPEACPFFLSAAHGFLESDGSAAVDTDADVPTGAFDDPANRYRVRCSRALRRRTPSTAQTSSAGGED